MSIFMSIFLGVLLALATILVSYPFIIYIKLKNHELRVRRIYTQLKNQIDIKHNMLVSLESKNRDILKVVSEYDRGTDKYDLKKYNNSFNYYILASKNQELIDKCSIAENKINYLSEYYNEVVYSYNEYKTNVVATYLAKSFSFEEHKLY